MRTISILCVLFVALLAALPAAAQSKEEQRIADATEVLRAIGQIPEKAVPPSLLAQAHAVAVIPNVIKVGFIFGGRRGKGLLVVRDSSGKWSNPSMVTLTAGNVGWQVGAQSTDIILVFKNAQGVDGITRGKLTLGADASVAAGPVGRHTSAATDIQLKAEVYSYSRSRGLFAGVAVEGAAITIDRKANAKLYGQPDISARKILYNPSVATPASVNPLLAQLAAQTKPVASVNQPADSYAEPVPQEAQTFGIGGPEDDAEEIDDAGSGY